MRQPSQYFAYNVLDRVLIGLIDNARKMAHGSYQDCFETTEQEALRYAADLIDLRCRVQEIQHKYLGGTSYKKLEDEDILALVREAEEI